MTKFESQMINFEKALNRLKEALAAEKNDLIRDSAIQRFEFTLDLAWKTLKTYLEEYQGVRCVSPKECLREGFQNGIIENDPFWLELVDLRNETVHTYKEEVAERVYGSLPRAVGYFETLLKKISEK